MLNFGELLKNIRRDRSLSQRDVVDIICRNNYKLIGTDVVSLSRWENGVTLPSHRRQVDIIHALDGNFYQLVCRYSNLVERSFDVNKLLKNFVWENHTVLEDNQLRCVVKKQHNSEGELLVHKTYLDSDEIPIGQITFLILGQEAFWSKMRRAPIGTTQVGDQGYLMIKSIFSTSQQVLQEIIGGVAAELLSYRVKGIGYTSNNSQSQIMRFLKSLGFKPHERSEQFNSALLSYYDAVYNKSLFYCSVIWELGRSHDS